VRTVLDVVFVEMIQFQLPLVDYGRCRIASSQEEVLRQSMARVGLELIDYGSFTVQPVVDKRPPDPAGLQVLVTALSKAYCERAERVTSSR
jgi:hypothetical protein